MIRMHDSSRWIASPAGPKNWILSSPYVSLVPALIAATAALFFIVVHVSAYRLGHLTIEVPSDSSPTGTTLITFPWAPISLCANHPPEQFIYLFSQLALAIGILVYIRRLREAFVESCCNCLILETPYPSLRITQPVLLPPPVLSTSGQVGGSGTRPYVVGSGTLNDPPPPQTNASQTHAGEAGIGQVTQSHGGAVPPRGGLVVGSQSTGSVSASREEVPSSHERDDLVPEMGVRYPALTAAGGHAPDTPSEDLPDLSYRPDQNQAARNFSLSASHDSALPEGNLHPGSATENPPPAPVPLRAVWAPYFRHPTRDPSMARLEADPPELNGGFARGTIMMRRDGSYSSSPFVSAEPRPFPAGKSSAPSMGSSSDSVAYPASAGPMQIRELGLLKKRRPLLGLTLFLLQIALVGMVLQAVVPVEKDGLQKLGASCRLVRDAAVNTRLLPAIFYPFNTKLLGTGASYPPPPELASFDHAATDEVSPVATPFHDDSDQEREGPISDGSTRSRMARQEGRKGGSHYYKSGSGIPIVPVAERPPREDLIDIPGEYMEGQVGMRMIANGQPLPNQDGTTPHGDSANQVEEIQDGDFIPSGGLLPTIQNQSALPRRRLLFADFLGELPLLQEGRYVARHSVGASRRSSAVLPAGTEVRAEDEPSPNTAGLPVVVALTEPPKTGDHPLPQALPSGRSLPPRWLQADDDSSEGEIDHPVAGGDGSFVVAAAAADDSLASPSLPSSFPPSVTVTEFFSAPHLHKMGKEALAWLRNRGQSISKYSVHTMVTGESEFRELQGPGNFSGDTYLARDDDVVYCPSMGDFSGDYWTLIHACASLLFIIGAIGAEVSLLLWLIVHRLRYSCIHWCQRRTGFPKQGPQIRRLFRPGWFSVVVKILILVFMFLTPISWGKNEILTKWSSIDLVGISQRYTVGSILLYVATLGFEIRTMRRTMVSAKNRQDTL